MAKKVLTIASTVFVAVAALVFIFTVVGANAVSAQEFEEGNVCVDDISPQPPNNCTANDVLIEELVVVNVIETCQQTGVSQVGQAYIEFDALVVSNSPNRYDIGLWLATDGGSAKTGDFCIHTFLTPTTTSPNYFTNISGTQIISSGGPYWDGENTVVPPDYCGDIEANTNVIKSFGAVVIACVDEDNNGFYDTSVCASWDNNTNTTCTDLSGAVPGTRAKCGCNRVDFPFGPSTVSMAGVGSSMATSLPAVLAAAVMMLSMVTFVVIRRRRVVPV